MKLLRKFNQEELKTDYEAKGGDVSALGWFCTRLAFKFAALQIAGEEFKFNNANLLKTAKKSDKYHEDVGNYLDALKFEMPGLIDLTIQENAEGRNAIVQAVGRDHLSKWASKFTGDKEGNKTSYSLSVGTPVDGTLASYLEEHEIKKGEALLIGYDFL